MEGLMEKSMKTVQSEQTRERIIKEATRLFARKGYFATSIADIATAVELTKGALYHHFESKEALFFAVLENIKTTWESTVARRVVQAPDAVAALAALIEGHSHLFEENEFFCLALNSMMMEMEGVQPEFHSALQAIYVEFVAFLTDVLKKGQEARQIRADIDPRIDRKSVV
jgi:AcrR family transcriptional regulator